MTYQDADTASPYGMAAFYIIGGPGASFSHFDLSVEVSTVTNHWICKYVLKFIGNYKH